MADQSVNCIVTSPPYYGLRDYETDDQIGLEKTPEEFIEILVNVFHECKRVLRDDGTLWVNIGDSYARNGGNDGGGNRELMHMEGKQRRMNKVVPGYKEKDLIGIPWMLAFALRADGWYLRQDIIWSKPNAMPESVTDRCTKSHEYIFLLSKSQKYYYDHESIKEQAASDHVAGNKKHKYADDFEKNGTVQNRTKSGLKNIAGIKFEKRNKRSVWSVPVKPFKEAHFATFPQELIYDCIKAGAPEGGVILDPFMGAGTTAVVSRKLNRNYIGFELNPDYISISEKRIIQEVGLFA